MPAKSYKEQNAERRDNKHIRSEDLDEDDIHVPSKKDTKTWCKGKIGKNHKEKVFSEMKPDGSLKKKELRCESCGKILETYYPFLIEKPEWASKEE